MVEPEFSIEEVEKHIDRIRVARVEAEIEAKKQQIDHPAVEMIHALRWKNAKLEEALRECVRMLGGECDYDEPLCITKAREVLGDGEAS